MCIRDSISALLFFAIFALLSRQGEAITQHSLNVCNPLWHFQTSSAKMSWARVFPLDLLWYLNHKNRLSYQQTACIYSLGISPIGKDQYHRKPFFREITPAFFFAFLMVDFLNPAASSFSSQSEESISPSFSISIRNAFALTSLSFGLPIFGTRDWNASAAVISISEMKSTPFSDTSNRMAEPVGARLDFTCTKRCV